MSPETELEKEPIMKKNHAILLTLVLAVCGTLLLDRSLAQPDVAAPPAIKPATAIAVCDVEAVFEQSKRAGDLAEEFQKRGDAFRIQAQEKLGKIKEEQAVLAQWKGREGSKDYERQFSKVQEMSIKLKVWEEVENMKIKRDRYNLTRELYGQIMDTIAVVAKKRGIQMVIYRSKGELKGGSVAELLQRIDSRKVLYNIPEADLTATVLTQLNAK